MDQNTYAVYITSNKKDGVLYVGVTSDLPKRIWEHKNKVAEGFTGKYNCDHLVYYEIFDDPENAIRREKRLKHWLRAWKVELINASNPEWKDLYDDIAA